MSYNDFGNPRTSASPYNLEDKMGRLDSIDLIEFNVIPVSSGTAASLSSSSLGRRNFIRVKNLDSTNSIYLLANADDVYSVSGYEVPAGIEWEDNTGASLYAISTVSGVINVQVYERSSRFNYK
jgi:hypothetical protein